MSAVSNIRYDSLGKITAMAWTDTYVMVRRPHAMPFVLSMKEWRAMSDMPLITVPA